MCMHVEMAVYNVVAFYVGQLQGYRVIAFRQFSKCPCQSLKVSMAFILGVIISELTSGCTEILFEEWWSDSVFLLLDEPYDEIFTS